ncbi:hypothetical protein L195_g060993 [Trifolium pratense]|uniref:Uncharacterized protein n=1 Tax=Trifolium pratense TaxID=57577 RepID=A0A2K3K768_TRIPR|nr:hypothetical protein L195_g060993 [Trifolium pratense]
MLVEVNIPDSWLAEAASALCCKGKDSLSLSGCSYWGRFEASGFLGIGVGSFKE